MSGSDTFPSFPTIRIRPGRSPTIIRPSGKKSKQKAPDNPSATVSTAYAAAKFGLLGFTQSLFAEVRDHGIKVAAICPGLVDTDLIPRNKQVDRDKFLHPDDIAEVVYDVLISPLRACPTEIVLEPQYDPEA